MTAAPGPYQTAASCNLWSGGFQILVGCVYLFVWQGLWSILVGVALLAVGVWQVRVGIGMRAGERQANARSSLIVGTVAAALSLNPINALLAGFGFMQVNQPDVTAWLEG